MIPEPLPPPPSVALPRLSKSKFLSGLQCHKRLYLELYHRELAAEPDPARQALLDSGSAVGLAARGRFPGGCLVETSHLRPAEALQRTAELITDPAVPAIYEGAVEFDQVLVRVDILVREGDAWRLIEVKSSGRMKDIHLDDLAVQCHVLRGAGLVLSGVCLMHINPHYLYDGVTLDLAQLFTIVDLTAEVQERLAAVPPRLAAMKRMLEQPSAPAIEPDGHCRQPFDCPFWDHCTKAMPPRWIHRLPGGQRAIQPLLALGIRTMDQIPDDFPLTTIQRRVKEEVEWIGPGLLAALRTVRYPVHHLDFETFMPGIPRFALTRPYQMIPTQWSNHIEASDGGLTHHEYLCVDPRDPREELTASLLDALGEEGSICVYSSYEQTVLESLAEAFPSFRARIENVLARLWDLLPVIQAHYYHPGFAGSFSIKSVLPALVPELGYGDLVIRDGGTAAGQYERMIFEETDWVERERIRENLRQYCRRDTLAMVALRKALLAKATGEAA